MNIMSNWIVCPVRNNLHLTKKAIKTFRRQDIEGGVKIIVINNASSDGTTAWLDAQKDLFVIHANPPMSVAESWNAALRLVFDQEQEPYCLVVNNDVELRPDTYRHLVNDRGGFVTAVGTKDKSKIEPCVAYELLRGGTYRKGQTILLPTDEPIATGYPDPDPAMKRPHPDFSCYLIRRETWNLVGPFDENFKMAYCEDWDMHVRLHKAGIAAECLDLPFLHHGAETIKNADPAEMRILQKQAQKNRDYFKSKWGMAGASEEYYRFFGTGAPPNEDVESTP